MRDPENAKLLWGFLFEVRRFAMRLSPETEGVKRIKSTTFTTHVLEAPSGFVFVLTTENKVTKSLDSNLKHIYKNIFVEMVSKNPTQDPHGRIKSKVRAFEHATQRNTNNHFTRQTQKFKNAVCSYIESISFH